MNYYPFHLGDYAAHTGHLEPMEDLAYRRLLDVYYMREGALPADIQVTAKLVRLRSCAADVESVLNEFFVLTEDGWRHQRCEREIEKMQDKQAKARASAQASVNSRRAKAERTLDESPTDVERSLVVSQTDVELPTPTPTPTPVNTTAKAVVGVKRRKPQSAMPEDFTPNETGMALAAGKNVAVEAELQKFRDYHAAKGSVMADWQAAWRTWVGNARPGVAGQGDGAKRGSDSYAAAHKYATWWREAGFDSVWDAMNAKCWHNTAHQFRDGKKIRELVL